MREEHLAMTSIDGTIYCCAGWGSAVEEPIEARIRMEKEKPTP